MKKLLVMLVLGAGFVTVASANEALYCDVNPSTNQCCNDFYAMQDVIDNSATYILRTTDGNNISGQGETLVNDGTGGTNCIDYDFYTTKNIHHQILGANFEWQPGNWSNTIKLEPTPSSANKDNAIITNN